MVQPQRRLNLAVIEVVRKKFLKLLEAGITYPISDSYWVRPMHVVPKKGEPLLLEMKKCIDPNPYHYGVEDVY